MPRARFIRPEFFTDEGLSELSFGARLLFAGLWCHSDLRGVFERSPKTIRLQVFPFDEGVTCGQISDWLDLLDTHGMTVRFEADGKSWGHVIHWNRHQQISGREREIGTNRPAPPGEGHAQDTPGTRLGQDRAASPSPTPSPTPTLEKRESLNARSAPPPTGLGAGSSAPKSQKRERESREAEELAAAKRKEDQERNEAIKAHNAKIEAERAEKAKLGAALMAKTMDDARGLIAGIEARGIRQDDLAPADQGHLSSIRAALAGKPVMRLGWAVSELRDHLAPALARVDQHQEATP